MKITAVILLLAVCASAEIIPATNAPTAVWAVAGVPGGIPNRTTIYTTLNPGATAAQIETAISNCPSNQVVKLSAGTFNLTDKIDISRDDWTLRGAGMGQTTLKFSASTTSPALNIGGGFGWTASVAITAGGTQGSSNVTVSSSSSYTNGALVAIDQLNSDWITYYGCGNDGSQTDNPNQIGKNPSSDDRAQVHYARVVGVAGNIITFWPPLPYDLVSGRSPQISRAATRGCHNSGIEDLTVDFSLYNSTLPSRFQGVSSFWLKNVEMFGWNTNFGIWFVKGVSSEVRGCYIHNPRAFGINRGYGFQADGLSGSLITDNIIYECMSNFLLQNGCTANVIAYNASAFGKYVNGGYTGNWLQHDISGNHTPFPCYNLFEGNYTSYFQSDYYYGPSGWGTIFRNRIPGNSSATTQHRLTVSIDARQRYYSVVGNQLGERVAPASVYLALPAVTRTYAQPGIITWGYDPGSASFSSPYIYRLGYPFSGNNSTGSGEAVQDSFVKNNTLRHGNWDAANNGVVWDAAIADHAIPDSLFLAAKPDWWGSSLTWPPYGTNAPAGITNELGAIPAGYRLLYGNNSLTITPQYLIITNYNTMKCVATARVNGAITNLSDLVGFGNYSPPSINGFYVKTNIGFDTTKTYRWIQGRAHFFCAARPGEVFPVECLCSADPCDPFQPTNSTYYLWLDSASVPEPGSYSGNLIGQDPPLVTWSVNNGQTVDEWGMVSSPLPGNVQFDLTATWGQYSNTITLRASDGQSTVPPSSPPGAQKAVLNASHMTVLY